MESSNQLRAVAHPVRLRMLSLLTGTELSAAEVARELGITHANASYHLRTLLDAGEMVIPARRRSAAASPSATATLWEQGRARRARLAQPRATSRRSYVRAMAEEMAPAPTCRAAAPAPLHRRRALGLPPRTTAERCRGGDHAPWRCTPPPGRRAPTAPSGSA